MREAREKEQIMKIVCLENTKKRRSIGKECILHVENSKNTTVSSFKRG